MPDSQERLQESKPKPKPIRCAVCGSTNTYGYPGNAGCRNCGAHDQDGG